MGHSFVYEATRVIFDEAHCISQWWDFRPAYQKACRLRDLVAAHTSIIATTATAPPDVLCDILNTLNLPPDQTETIFQSNDHPNIALLARPLEHPWS